VDTELLVRAWALLLSTSDIVEYVMCLIGERSLGKNIARKIRGQPKVSLYFYEPGKAECDPLDADEETFAYGGHSIWGGWIVICRRATGWRQARWIWDRNDGDAYKNCAALVLAYLLVHELGHTGTNEYAHENFVDACDPLFRLSNMWAWGTLERFKGTDMFCVCNRFGDHFCSPSFFSPVADGISCVVTGWPF
jgi:hypothetical protein